MSFLELCKFIEYMEHEEIDLTDEQIVKFLVKYENQDVRNSCPMPHLWRWTTGDLYKASSWSAPSKGIRYNLLNDESLEEVYERANWVSEGTYAS